MSEMICKYRDYLLSFININYELTEVTLFLNASDKKCVYNINRIT